MNFEEIYKSATSQLKIGFLDLLIVDNKGFEDKFVEFWKKSVAPQKEIIEQPMSFPSLVEDYKSEYLSDLEDIDLTPNWDDCNDGSYYRDLWEIVQEAGDEQIEEIMKDVKSELLNLILLQDVEGFVAAVIGLYQACTEVEIYDEHCAYEDINNELLNQFALIITLFADKIDDLTFNNHKSIETINEFFNYLDENQSQENSFVHLFEPLLLAFAKVTKHAKVFLKILSSSNVLQEDVPQLNIKLLQLSADDNGWIDVALSLYENNDGVAIQLLEYYITNDIKKYIELAKELFEKDSFIWSMYLEDKVSIEQDKDLFFIVIKELTISKNSISHYLKIRDLFDENSFNLLCEDLEDDSVFLVEILTYEKKYEAIKQIVKIVEDWESDFDKIIKPILNIYPDFCFATITKRLNNKIQHERGRDYYKTMAETLLLANQIKGFEKQSHELMLQLYNHKPNLPALKDEFREAGLV